MTNTRQLKSVLTLRGMTQIELANKMGVSPVTLSNKINNKIEFKASEIREISKLLRLTNAEIMDIFMN